MTQSEWKGLFQEVKAQILILGGLVALMWTLEIVDTALGGSLDRFGIQPRSISGLWGIFFAPWLHGSFTHLIANTIPFVTLGWLVMLRRTSDFFGVTAIALLVGGFGTWLIASPFSVHIGASGIIFGYLGFLLSRGYFERRLSSILISILIGVLYGGLLWGVLPSDPRISWEGHLFGFIGGVVAARLMAEGRIKG